MEKEHEPTGEAGAMIDFFRAPTFVFLSTPRHWKRAARTREQTTGGSSETIGTLVGLKTAEQLLDPGGRCCQY